MLSGDHSLLIRFREGDIKILERVYCYYAPEISSLLARGITLLSGQRVLGAVQRQDRLDLLQETFVRAFSPQARLAYDGVRDYRNYLFAICRNLLIDWNKSRGRMELVDLDSLSSKLAQEDPPDLDFADAQTRQLLEGYLAGLSGELSAVYQKRYVQCLTQQRACQELSISRQRLRTLEKKLQQGLLRVIKRAGLRLDH